jgi:uncharacterized protein YhaN
MYVAASVHSCQSQLQLQSAKETLEKLREAYSRQQEDSNLSENYYLAQTPNRKHRISRVKVKKGTINDHQKNVKEEITLLHLAPNIRKCLLQKGNVINNLYIDVRMHGIKVRTCPPTRPCRCHGN